MVDRVTAMAHRPGMVSVKEDMVASKPVVKAAVHNRAAIIHMAGMLRVKERAVIAGKAEETTVLLGLVLVI